METSEMTSPLPSFLADTSSDQLSALSRKMSQDPSLFEAASRDSEIAREVMSECGMSVEPGVEIRFVRQEDDVIHLTIPTDPNVELEEDQIDDALAGGKASSAGSLSTLPSTLLTLSSYASMK
jgi:hypothetical protein